MAFDREYVRIVLNENFEDAKRLLLDPMLAIDEAHLVMLADTGILSGADARALRAALATIDADRLRTVAYSFFEHSPDPELVPTLLEALERENAEFFEAVATGRDGKTAANWVINDLFGRLNKDGQSIDASPVSAAQLAAIVELIGEGTISGKIAKELFEIVWTEGGDPREIVEPTGRVGLTRVARFLTGHRDTLFCVSHAAPMVSRPAV